MPTYDYECDACKHCFEEFQSMSEERLKKCPECKKKKLRRLIGTGAAILFKGSGFYQTDYRSNSYKNAAKADENVGSNGTTGTNGKSDTTKPADTGGSSAREAKSDGKVAPKKTQS